MRIGELFITFSINHRSYACLSRSVRRRSTKLCRQIALEWWARRGNEETKTHKHNLCHKGSTVSCSNFTEIFQTWAWWHKPVWKATLAPECPWRLGLEVVMEASQCLQNFSMRLTNATEVKDYKGDKSETKVVKTNCCIDIRLRFWWRRCWQTWKTLATRFQQHEQRCANAVPMLSPHIFDSQFFDAWHSYA